MMPRGFKPVGWVAAVGGAALSCYMLSLNVAAERAEVAKLERQIVTAKQEIRSLQAELGTRGRLSQLEHWNAEVLALSAPTSAQFLDDAVTLARFEQRDKTIDEKAKVQMASMETARPAPQAAQPQPRREAQPQIARKLAPVDYAAAAERAAAQPQPLLRQASFTGSEAKVVSAVAKSEAKPAPAKVAAKVEAPAVKAAPAKPATPKLAAKNEEKPATKTAEAKKAKSKPAALKTLVAKLDDDKPQEASGGSRTKAEAGLR
jgi:hypothetical protein